jgi:hypothetical protein
MRYLVQIEVEAEVMQTDDPDSVEGYWRNNLQIKYVDEELDFIVIEVQQMEGAE